MTSDPAAGAAIVEAALAEDVGAGDVTSAAVVDEEALCEARIVVKEPGVVCGLDVAAAVFELSERGSNRSSPTAIASSPARSRASTAPPGRC